MAINEDDNLAKLRSSLSSMPQQMEIFSRGLRSLYAENAVSGAQSMASFRKVRDDVRRDAFDYVSQVLPVASTVVLNLSSYFDTFLALDFEDWQESVNDIIKDLESYKNASQRLIQMHDDGLIVSLRKREDEANNAIVEMKQVIAKLEEKEDRLKNEAAGKQKMANEYKKEGDTTTVVTNFFSGLVNSIVTMIANVTGGASLVMGAAVAEKVEKMGEARVAVLKNQQNNLELEAKSLMVQMVSEEENARVAIKAAKMTKDVLILVVGQFLDGFRECQSFFEQTESRLIKLSNTGQTAVESQEASKNLEMYYKMMKKYAAEINASCDCFVGALGKVSMKHHTTYPVFIAGHSRINP
jgi:hypothetical protein